MTTLFNFESRRRVFFCLFVLSILTAVFVLPFQMRSTAEKGLVQRTESHDPDLPNYDIRSDKMAYDKIAAFRTSLGRNASQIANAREAFVRGEEALKQRVPTLKVEYNEDIRIPEVIAPDVKQGRAFLTGPTTPARTSHANVLINFLKQNTELVGADSNQIDGLKVFADYTNPDGNLSFVELNQEINGVPVFRGEVKAGFTKRGEMIRVINNLAPALDYSSLSTDFRDPVNAVQSAAALINNDTSKLDLRRNTKESTDLKAVFGTGGSATTAEKMYFPTEPGVAVPAWRVLIWQPVNAFYVIVDAATGTMLWRKNIVQDQTQAATYNVYTNPNAMINVADSPFPGTPGPTSPDGTQAAGIPRTMMTLIGNEPPYQFNNNGWMTDGTNTTDGNAVQAGLDRDSANGPDANGSPAGSPTRVFDFPFTPGIPTNPAQNGGDEPLPAGTVPSPCGAVAPEMIDYQRAAVTQLFYITNRIHDEYYRLGFTEQARNFQQDNFGRGGAGNDRVSAEAQDCSGTNNANFGTPSDGGRPRMQMYLWTGPTPDFDGDLDADVIVHEYTHGLSNRLHGNSSGLGSNMSGGMGEGWGDFYGHAMLSEPTDPINGIYTTGGYDTYRGAGGAFFNNYYYGIRRFPKAVIAFTGGPNNRPHNPLTFADADATQLNISDGAYARGSFGSSTADQVHGLGEIWSSALWEVRAKFITRLGWEVGNRRTLQLVTDGMKLAPLNPTFITERDAIIAAAQALGGADTADVWAGFALRGVGFSAQVVVNGSGGSTRVIEAFDLPNLRQLPNFTISDSSGNNNGYFEPSENVLVTVPINNSTGNIATDVMVAINGGSPISYGTIANSETVSRTFPVTLPAVACGSTTTLNISINSSLGQANASGVVGPLGVPSFGGSTENFDGVPAPALPAAWTQANSGAQAAWITSASGADTAPNSAFGNDAASPGESSLISPLIQVTSSAASVTFRNQYSFETPDWDAMVLEISIANGAFQDIVAAGGSFVTGGYTGTVNNTSGNPLGGRMAWIGVSAGYITSTANLPASANGQNVKLRWRIATDAAVGGVGANVDTVSLTGAVIQNGYTCPPIVATRSRADFDGDGKTDISVFRPSDGNWYLQRSTEGFTGVNWGLSTDILTPGDFDGDGLADTAVFRPSNGYWYGVNSGNGTTFATNFGLAGDVPQVGDFDNDGKDDIAVFRPSNGTWYWLRSSDGQFVGVQYGQNGDVPVIGDYSGDGKADVAVFRSGIWYGTDSSDGSFNAEQFGLGTDLPVPADYDGDDIIDLAVFRPSDGNWYIHNSTNGQFFTIHWGQNGDVPVPGDYDGDGKDDVGVFRSGIWYINPTTDPDMTLQFGLSSDMPIPKKYIP
ncbi:MAG: M36 family metallopeptidase [Chloracidobacterium sp.]|nr:M36 family metallopeptidase [Chloracidobacterium sp.]